MLNFIHLFMKIQAQKFVCVQQFPQNHDAESQCDLDCSFYNIQKLLNHDVYDCSAYRYFRMTSNAEFKGTLNVDLKDSLTNIHTMFINGRSD